MHTLIVATSFWNSEMKPLCPYSVAQESDVIKGD
jgi:hypothetical protein